MFSVGLHIYMFFSTIPRKNKKNCEPVIATVHWLKNYSTKAQRTRRYIIAVIYPISRQDIERPAFLSSLIAYKVTDTHDIKPFVLLCSCSKLSSTKDSLKSLMHLFVKKQMHKSQDRGTNKFRGIRKILCSCLGFCTLVKK